MIQITDKSQCCGCTACESVCGHGAIAMSADEQGFKYPVGDVAKCVQCGLCEQVCPVLHSQTEITGKQRVLAMVNKNRERLLGSSSGGVWIELCDRAVQKGAVVYGVAYDKDMKAVYESATTLDGCRRFCGSKYVQSDLKKTFREIRAHLRAGKLVLFSGTPCYVKGLQNFLRKPYENLITADIICHGVPSPAVFGSFVRFIEEEYGSKVSHINMRDKRKGWSYSQLLLLQLQDGRKISGKEKSQLYIRGFQKDLFLRSSCHDCRFANCGRPGDLTIADFWGIHKVTDEFRDVPGVSLVIANTEKGKQACEEIKEQFQVMESRLEDCEQGNLHHPTPVNPQSPAFWDDWAKCGGDFRTVARKYMGYNLPDALKRSVRNCARSVLNRLPLLKKLVSALRR